MTTAVIRRVLLFGDNLGVPQVMKAAPRESICGLVCAETRPQHHGVLKGLAAQQGLPLLVQPVATSPAYPAFVEKVRGLWPELIVANSYSMLLREEVLAIPRYGAVNVHGALLPQYRGCNSIQWALLNGESETGVTMHYMTPEFDAGDIIAHRQVPIHLEDTWRDIQGRITRATDAMLTAEVPRLLSLTNDRRPQDECQARYYTRRRPEDGLIKWHDSVLAIYNLVRALVKPHPGAFYYSGPEKIVLDEYLTIPEVVGLKYGPIGGRHLQSALVRLYPITDGARQSNDVVRFAIRMAGTNRLIGACGLDPVNHQDRSGELQLRMQEASPQNARHVIEATDLLRQFAFADLNLRRLRLSVPANKAEEIGVYEKVGFVRERGLRRAAHVNGGSVDVVVMGILREEYGR